MTPEETAAATADAISGIASRFMTDGNTFKYGASIGFQGLDFYVTGRGGVLGDVDADVVSACFAFFNPETVRAQWELGCKVMPPKAAAAEFAKAAYAWAERSLPDDLELARLAELAGKVVDGASPAGAPIFAGWRNLPVPTDARSAAIHHLNGLRELRGGLHNGAVLATGMAPLEALVVRTPQMAPIFGWMADLPDAEPHKASWQTAESATNRAFGRVFEALSSDERAEFSQLVLAADKASA
ncbi:MAG: SCO6745 family protein [Acidimicrobiales bacterium]